MVIRVTTPAKWLILLSEFWHFDRIKFGVSRRAARLHVLPIQVSSVRKTGSWLTWLVKVSSAHALLHCSWTATTTIKVGFCGKHCKPFLLLYWQFCEGLILYSRTRHLDVHNSACSLLIKQEVEKLAKGFHCILYLWICWTNNSLTEIYSFLDLVNREPQEAPSTDWCHQIAANSLPTFPFATTIKVLDFTQFSIEDYSPHSQILRFPHKQEFQYKGPHSAHWPDCLNRKHQNCRWNS